MPIVPGTRLGPYEVQDFIGQGAMGVVYRAYHSQLERIGAVKVLQGIGADQDSAARFRHEAQAIAQMRHPNVVNVFDFGEYQGTPYMIVEYVPGGSLAAQMRDGPLGTAIALKYLRGIAAGIDYAHSLGIVHRDVKPANVLLEKDGTPVLADFGLVKLLQGSSMKSLTGVTTGTPAYMAPEQVTGSQVGPAADRYSLATMAYEMLTGVIPFDGEGVLEVMYAQVHRDPPSPSSRRRELGPRVDAVIMRGLAKDPDARWESCDAFVTALGQALAGAAAPVERTMVMTPPAVATAPLVESPAVVASPVAVATEPKPKRNGAAPSLTVAMAMPVGDAKKTHRRRYAIVAALILLLLLIGVGAFAFTRPSMSLSSTRVHPGDSLVISATRLPANQVGEIQLLSQVHKFPFRSDANGNVNRPIVVPADIELGDHIVRICWNGCRLQATLHVVSGDVALASPAAPTSSPGASPTPGASPSPGTRTSPGTRPTPSTPGAASPRPSTAPKPTPSPSAPPPPPPASITLTSISLVGGTNITFHYFHIGLATVTVWQNGKSFGPKTINVTSNQANWSGSVATPTGVLVTNSLLGIGPAYVVVCTNNGAGPCFTSGAVSVSA